MALTNTLRLRQILFATDFLESSRLALDYAVVFAHHFKAALVLVHAVELPPHAEEAEARTGRPSISHIAAQRRLEAFACGLRRTGLQVKTLVQDGTPCRVILDAAAANRADLLVLGVHGAHRGVGHLLLGSNTEKIILTASCPTLSVGAHVLGGLDLKLDLKEILYCSDLTPEAVPAASYALLLAHEFDVPVNVCHFALSSHEKTAQSPVQFAEEYCAVLRREVPQGIDPWCTPKFHLKRRLEPNQVLQKAAAEPAGLIVLGVHQESLLSRHFHTSFAYKLLTRAVCPVLTVRVKAEMDQVASK